MKVANKEILKIGDHKCTECSYKSPSQKSVQNHFASCHIFVSDLPISYYCDICGEEKQTKNGITQHMGTHTAQRDTVSCQYCNKRLRFDSEDVKNHLLGAHTDQFIAKSVNCCPSCGEHKLHTSKLYMQHICNKHDLTDIFDDIEQENICPECSKSLSSKRGMLHHFYDEHELIESYICVFCRHIFTSYDKIQTHIQDNHINQNNYEDYVKYHCNICDTGKDSIEQLSQHYDDTHRNITLSCRECQRKFTDKQTCIGHYLDHGNIEYSQFELNTTVEKSSLLKHLHNINKQTKILKKQAQTNYRTDSKTTARENSIKKDALYDLKYSIIQQIYEHADTIKYHVIQNNRFYYLGFEQYKFHVPIQSVDIPDCYPKETEYIEMNSHSGKKTTDTTLRQSLLFFKNELNENANNYLEQRYLSNEYNQKFIGWMFLCD